MLLHRYQNIDTNNEKWTKYFLSDEENKIIADLRKSNKTMKF